MARVEIDLDCKDVDELLSKLGSLAPWIVRPEYHEQISPRWRARRVESGEVYVPFLLSRSHQALWSGFLLPLRWEEASGADERLPAQLRELGEQIVSQIGAQGWRLSSALGERERLDGLALSVESAWAPLTAALLARRNGLVMDPWVFATGSWDEARRQIVRVEGIEQKLEAINATMERFGRTEAVTVFVPAENDAEAKRIIGERGWDKLLIQSYPDKALTQDEKTKSLFHDHLVRLDSPPIGGDLKQWRDWCDREGYEKSQPVRDQYYRAHIMPLVVEKLRGERGGQRVQALATLVSSNGDTSALCIKALEPEHVFLLHTGDSIAAANTLAQEMGSGRHTLIKIDAYEDSQEDYDCVSEKLDRSRYPSITFDVTGGTKLMSLKLMRFVIDDRDEVIYVLNRQDKQRCFQYGEERFLRFNRVLAEERGGDG